MYVNYTPTKLLKIKQNKTQKICSNSFLFSYLPGVPQLSIFDTQYNKKINK